MADILCQLRALVERLNDCRRLAHSWGVAQLAEETADELSRILETPAEPTVREPCPAPGFERWCEICGATLLGDAALRSALIVELNAFSEYAPVARRIEQLEALTTLPAEPVLSESVPRTAIVKLYERWLECARDLRDDGLGQAASDYEERAEELYERLLTPPAQPTQPEPSEAEREARARLGRWCAEKPMRQWNLFWHMGRCFVKLCDDVVTAGPFCDDEPTAIHAALDAAGAER